VIVLAVLYTLIFTVIVGLLGLSMGGRPF
jgi:hypothetical protein